MSYNQLKEVIFLENIFIDDSTLIREIKMVYYYTPSANTFSDYSRTGTGICELIYKTSGETIVTYRGKTEREKTGFVRFLPNTKDVYNDYKVERIEKGECIAINFLAESAVADEMVILDMSKNEKIGKLFEKLYGIWSAKEDAYYERSMAVFYEIISILKIRGAEGYLPQSKYSILEPALKYIAENWNDPDFDFSVPPRLSGVSYSYYKQLFKKRFGISPSKYLQNLRMKNAAELLDTCLYTVGEVAAMTGFANIYYFSRCFKEQMGIPPGAYAERTKNMAR